MSAPESPTPSAFFVARTAEAARQMTMQEAEMFLTGCLELCGDIEEVRALRVARGRLHDSLEQLQLIAEPQARLPLDFQCERTASQPKRRRR